MKVLVLSSLAYSLVNFRGDLLKAMIDNGHDVIACAPDRDVATQRKLAAMGVEFHLTPMQRTGTSVLSDLRLVFSYVLTIWRHKPDIVLAYTQKPIIYGGIAARFAAAGGSKPRFYALMSGLGQVFSTDADYPGWLRAAVVRLYRTALAHARTTFVFNADDRNDMIALGIVNREQRVIKVPGSGVSLERFPPSPPVTDPIRFLLIARLMRNKGIMEFLEASRVVRQTYPGCQFQIVGRCEDENPSGISHEESHRLAAQYGVELVPGTDDVRPYLTACSVFVLPSYYREGLPRTILEALASGRPIITTDLPGCRDAIRPGNNGMLVLPRSAESLAEAMKQFAADPSLVGRMGSASLEIAREIYDVRKVNHQLLREMDLLRSSNTQTPQGFAHSDRHSQKQLRVRAEG
ncbi:glycosyltransferase family 4 protein [Qipengyuania flava]|nr:glycosyltransferase family 4 protein [Qipengyuania flava]